MQKNFMPTFLAAALLIACLAGCAGSPETESATPSPIATASETAPAAETPAAQETPAAESTPAESDAAEPAPTESAPAPTVSFPLFAEPTAFTIWTASSPDLSEIVDEFTDYKVIAEMEKLTNLHWEATMISFTAQTEQFNLMVAAQEYTDVCNGADSYTGGADKAVEDDFLIDITDLVAENMPNLSGWYNDYPDLKKAMTTLDGNMTYFPKLYTKPSLSTAGAQVRMDWLEDLGIDAPKTYDDLYDMLTAFKTEKAADQALIIPASGAPMGGYLIGGYNINAGWYQVDGEVRYGLTQPEYKDYLAMLNKWYTEGLIWKDFYSQDTERIMDFTPLLTGRTGLWYSGVQDMSTLEKQAEDPNFRVGGLTEVSLDGGKPHIGEAPTMLDMNAWAVTTACEDPVSVCKYVDYLYSDAGILLANYGVEGETFEYDENGKPHLTELVTNNPDYEYRVAVNLFTCERQTPVPYVIDQDKTLDDYSEDQLQAIDAWGENSDYAYNLPASGLNFTLDESTEMAGLTTDIETYTEENIVKFIIGDTPLSEFDDFVAHIQGMNIDRCREIEQAAYDRYLGK